MISQLSLISYLFFHYTYPMVATIVLSQDLEKRIIKILEILEREGLKKNHPDLLYFDGLSKLGVEEAKKIREHFALKPFLAKGRGAVLESGDKLTHDAQNALLKTLEEPPEKAVLILGANSTDAFLATVLSRCQVIRIEDYPKDQENKLLKNYLKDIEGLEKKSLEEKFLFIEKLEEKEQFLEALSIYYHQKMQKNPSFLEINKKLLKAQEWKKSNVNIRAILEYLMMKI